MMPVNPLSGNTTLASPLSLYPENPDSDNFTLPKKPEENPQFILLNTLNINTNTKTRFFSGKPEMRK